MAQNPQQPQDKKYLLIDTNIVQYAGNKNKALSKCVVDKLINFEKEGYSIVISQYSVFENLQGLWGQKSVEAAGLLSKFEQKIVNKEVLVLASILGGLYGSESDLKGISDGDKIIAATAMLINSAVLTRNHRDFPIPFFTQENFYGIDYKDGAVEKMIDIGLYRPNIKFIGKKLSAIDNRHDDKKHRR